MHVPADGGAVLNDPVQAHDEGALFSDCHNIVRAGGDCAAHHGALVGGFCSLLDDGLLARLEAADAAGRDRNNPARSIRLMANVLQSLANWTLSSSASDIGSICFQRHDRQSYRLHVWVAV